MRLIQTQRAGRTARLANDEPERELEVHKQAEIDSRRNLKDDPRALRAPFTEIDEPYAFTRWATVGRILDWLEIDRGSTVLDIGCGTGWTTAFFAESGFVPTGLDIVPVNVEIATGRAARWGVPAEFVQADMERFDLGRQFDCVFLLDALHHSTRPRDVIANAAAHLRPGGWLIVGEPSWLHWLSPHARQTSEHKGWVERGVTARQLRRDCTAAGLVDHQRFFQGTHPYRRRTTGFGWELVRLVAANFAMAPQALIWFAARRNAELVG